MKTKRRLNKMLCRENNFTNNVVSAPGQLILNRIVSSNPLYSLHVTTINRNVYHVKNEMKTCVLNIVLMITHKKVNYCLDASIQFIEDY